MADYYGKGNKTSTKGRARAQGLNSMFMRTGDGIQFGGDRWVTKEYPRFHKDPDATPIVGEGRDGYMNYGIMKTELGFAKGRELNQKEAKKLRDLVKFNNEIQNIGWQIFFADYPHLKASNRAPNTLPKSYIQRAQYMYALDKKKKK